MRPFIPQMAACLGLLQVVAVSGCGGSRERIQDGRGRGAGARTGAGASY